MHIGSRPWPNIYGMKTTEFARWTIRHFTTREHFVRTIASIIIGVAMWEVIMHGKIEDTMLLLVGNVMGFYFKGHSEREADRDEVSEQVTNDRDTATIKKTAP